MLIAPSRIATSLSALSNHANDPWSQEIVNHLWQSTLVVALAWLLARALKRYRAETRYWVWMAASIKFLLPFSALAALARSMRPARLVPLETSPLAGAVLRWERPFAPFAGAAYPGSLAEPDSVAHHALSMQQGLLLLWLCGVLVLLVRWARTWLDLRVTMRTAAPASLPIDVPVLLTPRRIEPGVIGLFRPVLLLPAQIFDRLPSEQIRAILAHERCHVQRRDNLTAAIHMLVEAIFWFHPAVWWIETRLVAEREAACDEAVLQLGSDPEVYAQSILNVCKFYAEAPLVCMSGVTGAELKQRILSIMTKGAGLRLDRTRKLLLGALSLAFVLVPLLSGLLRLPEVHAQAKPAPAATSSAAATGIAATWQGTLKSAGNSRFVVRITAASDGTLKSTFYNLSGRPGGSPGFATLFNGSALKLDFGFATYDGSMSPDGSSIAGTWHQGPDAQSLTFVRATPATEWSIAEPPPHPAAMPADARAVFEVSTIKPSAPEQHGPRYRFDDRRLTVVHVTLDELVQFAYGVQQKQIAGAPGWFAADTYDIAGQPGGEGEPSIPQWKAMVRQLMVDRFQLKFHTEKREMSVYALTLAKSGPKFARSEASPKDVPMLGFGPGNMGATNATMAQIAEAIQQGALDRPVVDQTGLPGRFDLRMRWTPADVPAAAQNIDAPPDLFTAIEEQLGLKLVPVKAAVDVLVIDRVEKPSAN